MKLHFVILLLFFGLQLNAQSICNPIGNLAVFSNYDGGILTINVDQNIPNLKIGICTYEPIQVSFTGASGWILESSTSNSSTKNLLVIDTTSSIVITVFILY